MCFPLIQQGTSRCQLCAALNSAVLPCSKFLGWHWYKLYRYHGHLLLQCMERTSYGIIAMSHSLMQHFWLQSKAFPMLSTSIFSSNGTIYPQSAVFDTTFQLNQTALNEI